MHVDEKTFAEHEEAAALLPKIHRALRHLSGKPRKGRYGVPPKLVPLSRPYPGGEEARLLPTFMEIWRTCHIVFDPNERGASIHVPTGKIRFGPFFVSGWKRSDLEKVILHEYLHKAISIQPSYGSTQFRKEAQHGEIDQIIEFELRYTGHPRGNRQLD